VLEHAGTRMRKCCSMAARRGRQRKARLRCGQITTLTEAEGGECSAAKRMRRSRQEQRDAGPTRGAGLTAGSARFRRRVRVQGNGPRTSRLRASDVRAVQEHCAGDATGRIDLAGGYAGVPTLFLQHTRVSRGSLAVSRKTLRFAKESA
jgi:hypothetical protein